MEGFLDALMYIIAAVAAVFGLFSLVQRKFDQALMALGVLIVAVLIAQFLV